MEFPAVLGVFLSSKPGGLQGKSGDSNKFKDESRGSNS